MSWIEWSRGPRPRIRVDWRIRMWMYHRLANAGRLQIGRLILTWPMPWSKVCHGQPGYGFGQRRWQPVLDALPGRRPRP